MKKTKSSYCFISVLLFSLLSCLSLSALSAALLNPNQVIGRVSFTNQNPDILSLLDEGNLTHVNISASSRGISPSLSSSLSRSFPASAGARFFDYQMVMEASDEGIDYQLTYSLQFRNALGGYGVSATALARVFSEPAPGGVVDVEHSISLARVSFVDGDQNPVAVTGGYMSIDSQNAQGRYQRAGYTSIVNGNRGQAMVFLPRGEQHRIQVFYDVGQSTSDDKVRNLCELNFSAASDEVVPLTCVIGGGEAALGSITGRLDLAGESIVSFSHFPRIRAHAGPLNNSRQTFPEADGRFTLPNMVPSSVVEPARGYLLYGEFGFGSGYDYQYMRGSYPENQFVSVAPGQTLDLGNTFELQPGYVTGTIALVGPVKEDTALNFLYRPSLNAQGQSGDRYVNSSSAVSAGGLRERAEGAQYSAVGISTRGLFEGDYNRDTGEFNGDYRLALAGYAGQASVWQVHGLSVRYSNTEPLVRGTVRMYASPARTRVEVSPGQTQRLDHHYCVNDVNLAYQTRSGTFYSPRLTGNGRFDGEDYRAEQVNYSVNLSTFVGSPTTAAQASDTGVVTMSLPQGVYTLRPSVRALNPDGTTSNARLPNVTLTVGCGQVVNAATDIQVNLVDPPKNVEADHVVIEGQVNADVPVTDIEYVKNEDAPVVVCNTGDCAEDGQFSVTVPLDEGVNQIEVTATSEDGSKASVTTSVERIVVEQLAQERITKRLRQVQSHIEQAPSEVFNVDRAKLYWEVESAIVALDFVRMDVAIERVETLIGKTNGCQVADHADEDDQVLDCALQQRLHPLLEHALALLQVDDGTWFSE